MSHTAVDIGAVAARQARRIRGEPRALARADVPMSSTLQVDSEVLTLTPTLSLRGRGSQAAGSNKTIDRLRDQLERYHAERAQRAGWERRFIPTGLTALDERLPHGGLPCGAVTEMLADLPGVGAMTLVMRIVKRCMERELPIADCRLPNNGSLLRPSVPATRPRRECSPLRPLIFIDTLGDFYPPAAAQHGIGYDRLIVLRTHSEQDAFWAMDQSLRCGAVAAVIAPLGMLNDRLARRLQLAAESSGCVGLILRTGNRPTHRFAAVRMRIEAISNRQSLHRITLLTVREGSPAEPFLVDLEHETGPGAVPAVSVDRTAMRIAN